MQDRLSIYVGLTIVLLFASLIFAILIPYILLLPIVPIICAVLSDIHFKKKAKALTNSEIVVLTDTLLYEKQNEVRREASLYKGKYISYLQFETNGRYELCGGYYLWSKMYKMSDSGICNTAQQGDEFYVVLYKKDYKIAMVYNKRFFEYKNN